MSLDPTKLSLEEAQVLDRFIYGYLVRVTDAEAVADPETERTINALRSVRRKLARSLPAVVCRHCKENPRRGNQSLCDRCRTFKRRTGKLPPEDVLKRSAERRRARRLSSS